ncbi:MAG: 3-deoxy-7-phosphoheptulonate synthase [Planctomycetota bacterium]|nr:MAG: 3-deoxy-7-phosphoheptulonate synthase [Planctomycetota bacterium]
MPGDTWSIESWRTKPTGPMPAYPDEAAAAEVVGRLRGLPPLVTSWEIERLRALLAEAQDGRRFVLQGGDCAERLADCTPRAITTKLKILLQMSLVLVHGAHKPVVRVGRFAGQYAKPRSSPTETRPGASGEPLTLPSYYGDGLNHAEFDPDARAPDPGLMLAGYHHAAMTLNFVRSLVEGGFADLHHPENWELAFMDHAGLRDEVRAEYLAARDSLAGALRFMEALGETSIDDLTRVEFFTSHEALNLYYESAQTRAVPRRPGHYLLTAHMPWIGERSRDPGGAHVELLRGVRNPIGVKIGPDADPADVVRLTRVLNPDNEPGRLTLILRLGAGRVEEALPGIVNAVTDAGARVLWMADPMHGNTVTTASGVKTRSFDAILEELERSFDAHARLGTRLGGVHFELTGEDVTECVGGAAGPTEADLARNYTSLCDPRLNYQQSMELAFRIARRIR